jgi:hypothetical protein
MSLRNTVLFLWDGKVHVFRDGGQVWPYWVQFGDSRWFPIPAFAARLARKFDAIVR